MQDPTWYYAVGEDAQGPVSQADLLRMIGRGEISLDTYVFEEGMEDWTPLKIAMADYLPEEAIAPPTPPPLPAAAKNQVQQAQPAQKAAPKPATAEGMIECAKCHQSFQPGMIVEKNGFKICALCDRLGPVR